MTERLRKAPLGYFFDVMTNGFGAMPDYASQISPQDRWNIVAYIRALQLSQTCHLRPTFPPDSRFRRSLRSSAATRDLARPKSRLRLLQRPRKESNRNDLGAHAIST